MRRLFSFPWRRNRDIRRDVDDELRFHMDARTEELVALGHSRTDAAAQALREFGDVNDARRYMNAVDRDTAATNRRKDYVSELGTDISYALRTMRRAPAFTIAAILTLAIGVGANAAIFSVVNGVVFRSLPYPEADRLVRLYSATPENPAATIPVSPLDIDDWRAERKAFAEMGGYFFFEGMSGTDLTGSGEPRRLSVAAVTPGFFETIGVGARIGRLPREDELVRGGNDRVVVLTDAFWRAQFGGRAAVVDSTITLAGEPYRVLGVMPAGFTYPNPAVEAWIPYSTIPDRSIPRVRGIRILSAVARMRPGVSIDAARADINRIAKDLAARYPNPNAPFSAANIRPLHDVVTGGVRRGLLVLLGAVGLVMVMACVNVASLLLARANARQREITVRVALGAGRGRVIRQLITESLVLGLVGGAVGVAVAKAALIGLLALSAGQLPRAAEVGLDGTVLGFALGLSLLTGLVFGLVPALRIARPQLHDAIRSGGRGTVGGSGRLWNSLVVAEVALATMLVIGAGLMTKSFSRLLDVDPGFRPQGLVGVLFTISTDRHDNYKPLYRQIIDRARAIPGIGDVAAVREAPFKGGGERWGILEPGAVLPPGTMAPDATTMFISDGLFKTIGAHIVEGREFERADDTGNGFPIVVNQTFARKFVKAGSAVGARFSVNGYDAHIVGVVADIKQSGLDEEPGATIYVNNMVESRVRMTLIARSTGDPMATARQLRDAIWSLDREQTITSIFTIADAQSEAVARPRLLTVLLGAFGLIGLALGAVGLYGVLAYLVSQQQREIGVRLALGAAPASLLRGIVRRGLVLTGAGLAIGLVGALLLGQFLQGVLFGVEPRDPAAMATAAAVLVASALVASWIPARRAAAVDPMAALSAGE